MASPLCPPPTTTVVVRTEPPCQIGDPELLVDLDAHVRGVRDDVEHGRPLLRLCDQRLDLIGRCVGVDRVGDLDVTEAVADVAVHAEDAADVHAPVNRGRHTAQLDLAVLRHRGDAGGQAAGQGHEHVLDRRGAVVL